MDLKKSSFVLQNALLIIIRIFLGHFLMGHMAAFHVHLQKLVLKVQHHLTIANAFLGRQMTVSVFT